MDRKIDRYQICRETDRLMYQTEKETDRQTKQKERWIEIMKDRLRDKNDWKKLK